MKIVPNIPKAESGAIRNSRVGLAIAGLAFLLIGTLVWSLSSGQEGLAWLSAAGIFGIAGFGAWRKRKIKVDMGDSLVKIQR